MNVSYRLSGKKNVDRVQSFWMKVRKGTDDECWEWIGSTGSPGYGQLWTGKTFIGAHRFSYELVNGKIPKGMWILHRCDNRKCVNPKHLFLGTQQDNENDKVSKGRQAKGNANGQSGTKNWCNKLSEDDVRYIRKSKESYKELSERFRVSQSMVYYIKSGRSWKWLT